MGDDESISLPTSQRKNEEKLLQSVNRRWISRTPYDLGIHVSIDPRILMSVFSNPNQNITKTHYDLFYKGWEYL